MHFLALLLVWPGAATELPALSPPPPSAVILRTGSWFNQAVVDDITWLTLLSSMALVLLVLALERTLRRYIRKKRASADEPGGTTWQRLLLKSAGRPISLLIWAYGLYGALYPLYKVFVRTDGSNPVAAIAARGAAIGATVALIWFLYNLTAFLDLRLARWTVAGENRLEKMLAPFLSKLARIFIVVVGGLMLLQNLSGVEIGPLIASLGIGGLAVALAAKDSIANFFGTLTILFDKPFAVGDLIAIDSYTGVVESVGFRSTRIRTLTGSLVTIPNEKVVNSGLENISRRPNLRWMVNIGLTYDTSVDKVAQAVEILRAILADHEGMRPELPPRVHFNGFNEWNLNITVLAWYHPPDWWAYQAWLQRICMDILRQFKAAGIDFAFPSRTLYLANDNQRRLKLEMLKGEASAPGWPPDGREERSP